MSDDIAGVTRVRAAGDRILRVRFAGDRRDRELDLTGLIARSVHFAPLMEDAKTFAKAAIVVACPDEMGASRFVGHRGLWKSSSQ
jgi:hypothetical protein